MHTTYFKNFLTIVERVCASSRGTNQNFIDFGGSFDNGLNQSRWVLFWVNRAVIVFDMEIKHYKIADSFL